MTLLTVSISVLTLFGVPVVTEKAPLEEIARKLVVIVTGLVLYGQFVTSGAHEEMVMSVVS